MGDFELEQQESEMKMIVVPLGIYSGLQIHLARVSGFSFSDLFVLAFRSVRISILLK